MINRFISNGRIFFCGMLFYFLLNGPAMCQGWSDLKVRLLPDSGFAFIETGENGQKIRRCPHHDINGDLNPEQLIYVMGAINRETWIVQKNKISALKHLEKHYERHINSKLKNERIEPVNINTARLTEFVKLPHIGPVMAVRIIDYREKNYNYFTIEDIMKVERLGIATFNSIKHYIKVK